MTRAGRRGARLRARARRDPPRREAAQRAARARRAGQADGLRHRAHARGARPHRDGRVLGTGEYLAPEQAHGGPVDARSDVYGLGVHALPLPYGSAALHGARASSTVAEQHVTRPCRASPARPELPVEVDRSSRAPWPSGPTTATRAARRWPPTSRTPSRARPRARRRHGRGARGRAGAGPVDETDRQARPRQVRRSDVRGPLLLAGVLAVALAAALWIGGVFDRSETRADGADDDGGDHRDDHDDRSGHARRARTAGRPRLRPARRQRGEQRQRRPGRRRRALDRLVDGALLRQPRQISTARAASASCSTGRHRARRSLLVQTPTPGWQARMTRATSPRRPARWTAGRRPPRRSRSTTTRRASPSTARPRASTCSGSPHWPASRSRTRSASAAWSCSVRAVARPLGVPLERELDQPVEQRAVEMPTAPNSRA